MRAFAACGLCAFVLLTAWSCSPDREGQVVLYSSADDYLLREVVAAFQAESGLRVRVLTDTEATRTFGLVERLRREANRPRADVWWGNEPFGTVRLAREGLFEPYASAAEEDFESGWPAELRDRDGLWYAFALRARVIAYNTDRVDRGDVPRTLRDLTDPRWRGRVGMARPEFGSTVSHMAALLATHGEDAYSRWLEGMKANGVRIYEGNGPAVQAVARGEIDICLTDTDDVWVGQRNGWPVDLVYEAVDEGEPDGLPSVGPLAFPNTVARVRGGPNPEAAAVLIDFLLSEEAERLIARSDSRNVPIRPHVAAESEFAPYAIPDPWLPNFGPAADALPQAIALARRHLGL